MSPAQIAPTLGVAVAVALSPCRARAEPRAALVPTAATAPHAGALRDPEQRCQLDLGDGWRRSDATTAIAAWTAPERDRAASLTRIEGAPAGAWRERDDFFAGVERGLAAEVEGFKRVRRRIGRLGRVPFMDIWYRFRTSTGELRGVAMRMLFFRRYVLSLAITAPAASLRRERRALRRALRSFEPYFTPEP